MIQCNKKHVLLLILFALPPCKVLASAPWGAIIEGAGQAKEIYEVIEPFLKPCFKAVKKSCKKVIRFVGKHTRGKKDKVYVNPARYANPPQEYDSTGGAISDSLSESMSYSIRSQDAVSTEIVYPRRLRPYSLFYDDEFSGESY